MSVEYKIVNSRLSRFTKSCKGFSWALQKMFVLFFTTCLLVSCEWVEDDNSMCKVGTWLRFEYTHNLLDVDAISNQVEDLSVFVFNANDDRYFTTIKIDSVFLHENENKLKLDLPAGTYKVLVWGGLTKENYFFDKELTTGKTTLNEVKLRLNNRANDTTAYVSQKLNALYYAYAENITVIENPEATVSYEEYRISLTKNTNNMAFLLQCDKTEQTLKQEDFKVVISSNNGTYDYLNNAVPDSVPLLYAPFEQKIIEIEDLAQVSHPTKALQANLNTMRLFADSKDRLEITYIPTGNKIINIPLAPYLLFGGNQYISAGMTKQEYLDRQDLYTLVFYIKYEKKGFVCYKIAVNSWIVRLDDSVVL